MRPKELVPILAERFGVSMETAWVLDRSLADNGLRTISKGRKPLDMTRSDGVHFLLACMTADVRIRAIDDVKYWASLEWTVPKKEESSTNNDGEEEGDLDDHDVEPLEVSTPPIGYFHSIVDNAINIASGRNTISLIDYLLLLMRWLSGHGPSGTVKFEISTTGNHAIVEYEILGTSQRYTDWFIAPRGMQRRAEPDPETGIHRSVHIYGEALMEIAARTADPLDEVLG